MLGDGLVYHHRLPGDTSAAWRARDFLIDLGLPQGAFLERAMLLTSEIVTDAIEREPDAEIALSIRVSNDRLRVHVQPANRTEAARPTRDDGSHDSLRLAIVDRIATAWGTEDDGHPGLWFELAVRRADPAAGVW